MYIFIFQLSHIITIANIGDSELYEGVSQTRRGANYNAALPDKITIFQKPIEREARSKEDLKEIVKNTVWHEIAHHFGMSEKEVREAEIKRRKKRFQILFL